MTAFTVPTQPRVSAVIDAEPLASPAHPVVSTGRRAGDLALGIARIRAGLNVQSVGGEARSPEALRSRHQHELAEAELRRQQAAVELTRAREAHLRAANWLTWQVADGQWRVLALQLAEALDRQYMGEAAQDQVAQLRAALAHSRAYVSALDSLELPRAAPIRPAPINTDPRAWLALVEGHPRVLQARQALESAAHDAPTADLEVLRSAWRAAGRSVSREVRVRLTRLRELVRRTTHAAEAARWADTLAERQTQQRATSLTIAMARQHALCAQAEWHAQASAAREALLDLQAFLGSGPIRP